MDYGRLLTRALELTWRYKWLWLLALFAGESAGSPSYGGQGVSNTFGGGGRRGGGSPSSPPDFRPVTDWIGGHIGLLVLLAVVLLALWVALFIVSCGAEAAVVRGTAAADAGEEIGLGRAISLGLERFGGVLRVRLLLVAVTLLVVVVAAAMVGLIILSFAIHAYLAATILIVVAIGAGFLLFLIALVYSTFIRLWLRAVILDRAGAMTGLGEVVALIRRRLGPVAVLWVIQLALSLVIAVLLLIVLFAFALPGGLIFIAAVSSHGSAVAVVPLVAFAVLLLIALVVLGAAISAYLSVYWTLGYRQLQA